MMNRKGTVIRFVEQLDISEKSKEIALKLVEQIDMPVVFLIDHDLDKNYATRSYVHHNQFWVLANHQEDQSEYERLILSNIYRGIQTRKRIACPSPTKEYEFKLNQIKNPNTKSKRIKLYYELLHKISALVTTIDAEAYFKPLGIEIGARQKEKLFLNRISILDEYITIQKRKKDFVWSKEHEYINVLDYARIASFENRYYTTIIDRLKKIQPISVSIRCVKRLNELLKMMDTAKTKYQSNNYEDITLWMAEAIIKIMQLEECAVISSEYALEGTFVMENGNVANVYSFVPEDIPNEKQMIKGIRIVNECILLLQEYYATLLNRTLPDVHANLIQSNHKNAYANIRNSEYYISLTSELISDIFDSVYDCINQVNAEYIRIIGKDIIEQQLIKYSLFYITAHEYAHIINGDCKDGKHAQAECNLINKKEEQADLFAKELLGKVLFLQYRPNMMTSLFSRIKDMQINLTIDPHLLNIACKWCDEYFLRFQNR